MVRLIIDIHDMRELLLTSFVLCGRDQNSSIMSKLRAIQSSQQALGINHDSQFDRIREDILVLTCQEQQKGQMRIADHVAQLESLGTKLNFLIDEHTISSRNVQVIKSLHFHEVRRRFDQIPPAD